MEPEKAPVQTTSPHLFHIALSFLGLSFAVQSWLVEFGLEKALKSDLFAGLLIFSLIVFVIIFLSYFIKLTQHFKTELSRLKQHDGGHYSALSMSFILAGLLILPYEANWAIAVWLLGSLLQFVITTFVVKGWLYYDHWKITDLSPIWFMPLSGLLIIPVGIPEFAPIEFGWMLLSIGLIFWLILFSLMLYRLFFQPLLSAKKQLSFFIMATPPALGYLSYSQLASLEAPDLIARLLFYTSLFLSLLLLTQIKRFLTTPFCFDWWRIPLPFALMSVASLSMFQQLHISAFIFISALFLGLLAITIFYLSLRTLLRHPFLS
ncbi:MAG: hypothetical protein JXK16_06160 [Thiotrichales bacterium]|nr:hypothetical protein [Thiotrichales bacterium]